jgi:hypothetical protein
MIRIIAEATTRGPGRQPRTAGNSGAPPAATALATTCHRSRTAGHRAAAEPPLRAISRLATACARPGGDTAVTTAGALLADLPGTASADMGACLESLCQDLRHGFARSNGPRLSCESAAHQLPMGAVITLGLIADLLLTNAFVFGFVPPASGRIAVSFAALEASFELTIEDSGLVRPEAARGRAKAVTIAGLLVAELGGWLETPRVIGGSRCIVTLPRQRNRLSS